MSYLALARKWRPRNFSQLVGQEHVNKALINALNQQRIHHAYLFTGTRGVGKTSVARILAKSLNCEQGISAEPCLTCDACTAIEQGRFIDLIEIDGASKTRVEDTRELLDNVQYAPTSGRFKIYLIDEVHMLSQHSFNALLKTLEEPPQHVKFILATTDPQKLPVTVLSRCLQFHLKHISEEVIAERLGWILNEEGIAFENDALTLLARAAQGSMRDALSIMDQAITSSDGQLKSDDLKRLLGYTQKDYAIELLLALAHEAPQALLDLTRHIAEESGHFQYVLDEMLTYLHQLTIAQALGTTLEDDKLNTLKNKLCGEDIQLFYHMALNSKQELDLAPTPAIGFSMALFRMLTFRPAPLVEATVSEAPPRSRPQAVEVKTQPAEPVAQPEEPAPAPPEPVLAAPHKQWADIIPKLGLTGLALNAVEHAELVLIDNNTVTLKVSKGHMSLFTPATQAKIETALSAYYKQPTKIELQQDEGTQASPAQQKAQMAQKKLHHAEQSLQNDPAFLRIQQEFSAELVKNSIVSLKDEL